MKRKDEQQIFLGKNGKIVAATWHTPAKDSWSRNKRTHFWREQGTAKDFLNSGSFLNSWPRNIS